MRKLCGDLLLVNATIGPDALVEFRCDGWQGHKGKHRCYVHGLRRDEDGKHINDGYPMSDVSNGEDSRKRGVVSWNTPAAALTPPVRDEGGTR